MGDNDELALAIRRVAAAVTPLNAALGHDATGGTVASLTEAVMGITAALSEIADAIKNLADAVSGEEV